MSEPRPYFRPLPASADPLGRMSQHDLAEASHAAAIEEAAFLRALGGPPQQRPVDAGTILKEPVLPDGFEQQLAELDAAILARGISLDPDKLLSLGRERFAQLLELDRKCRRATIIGCTDLTRFESVQRVLHAFAAPLVPVRTTSEQAAGSGRERIAIGRIESFQDLWKFTSERDEAIHDLYAFHDAFESLQFGHELLGACSKDGRVRSRRLFCGGRTDEADLVRDWFSVVQGSFTSVRLNNPLWSLVAWLSDEKADAPSPVDLAKEFHNVRSPSKAQTQLVQAVLDGFCLDHNDWSLWEFVGRATRKAHDRERLASWRKQLAARFPRIDGWQKQLRRCFWNDVGSGNVFEAHREFDAAKHRLFLDARVGTLLDTVGRVMATALTDTLNSTPIARFQDEVLLEREDKFDQRAAIAGQLSKVFPGATFGLNVEELQP